MVKKIDMEIGNSITKSIAYHIHPLVYYDVWDIVNHLAGNSVITNVGYSLRDSLWTSAGLCESSMFRFINTLVITRLYGYR